MEAQEVLWEAFYHVGGSNAHVGRLEISTYLLKNEAAINVFGERQLEAFGVMGGQTTWSDFVCELEPEFRYEEACQACEEMQEELALITPRSPMTSEDSCGSNEYKSPEFNRNLREICTTLEGLKSTQIIARISMASASDDIEATLRHCATLTETIGCIAFQVEGDHGCTLEESVSLLRLLREGLPPHILIGLDTVLSTNVRPLAEAGVSFLVSPVCPPGFIEACIEENILAIPSAATPNELWNCNLAGAQLIRLDPSMRVWTPSTVASLPRPLREIPSLAGGIEELEHVSGWLQAGVKVVEVNLGQGCIEARDGGVEPVTAASSSGGPLNSISFSVFKEKYTERHSARGGAQTSRPSLVSSGLRRGGDLEVLKVIDPNQMEKPSKPTTSSIDSKSTGLRLNLQEVKRSHALSMLGARREIEETRRTISNIRRSHTQR